MAGNATHWIRPKSGALKGQAIFVRPSTIQALGMKTPQDVLAALHKGGPAARKAAEALAKQAPIEGGAVPRDEVDIRRVKGAADIGAGDLRFDRTSNLDGASLNGIPFTKATGAWQNHTDTDLGEPPLPRDGRRVATGVIIREPDGRMWIYEPTNHYAGFRHTFSGGGLEKGLTAQQNARKEAFEELGMDVKITGWAGDVYRDHEYRRYYIAERTGGRPSDAHYEAANVKLVSPQKAAQLLNKQYDKDLLNHATGGTAGKAPQVVEVGRGYVVTAHGTTERPVYLAGNRDTAAAQKALTAEYASWGKAHAPGTPGGTVLQSIYQNTPYRAINAQLRWRGSGMSDGQINGKLRTDPYVTKGGDIFKSGTQANTEARQRGYAPRVQDYTVQNVDRWIAAVDKTLGQRTTRDMITYRAQGAKSELTRIIRSLKPGDTYKDPAYTSTSVDYDRTLRRYSMDPRAGGPGVMLTVVVPRGTKGAYLPAKNSGNQQESEFLLARGTTYRLLSTEQDTKTGVTHAVVELVGQD